MKSYKLKLTALSPIHIGTGEDYEPTNFVIDNGYLYEFDEYKFYNRLDQKRQEQFIKAVERKKAGDSLFEIHRIIKRNKKEAIASAILKVQVSKGIERDYKNKIGRVVQIEGGRRVNTSKVFNRFQISKTIRQSNQKRVYIPASSIKGAISTAYQETIFKKDFLLQKELFNNIRPQENIFKNLMIADTKPIKTYSIIGFSLNKERFEDDETGPSTKLETIYMGSIFETTLQIRDYQVKQQIDFETLKRSCNDHYLPLFQQMFKPKTIFRGREVYDYTNKYFKNFYEKYRRFELKDNQFLLRVGKHSGARAVTIDGDRRIRVRKNKRDWEILDQETTTWLFGENPNRNSGLVPFGWVLCEIK
jgi:CRISPR-associated protein Csm5